MRGSGKVEFLIKFEHVPTHRAIRKNGLYAFHRLNAKDQSGIGTRYCIERRAERFKSGNENILSARAGGAGALRMGDVEIGPVIAEFLEARSNHRMGEVRMAGRGLHRNRLVSRDGALDDG